MASAVVPEGLGEAGAQLWVDIASQHDLDAGQRVTLLEVCRCKDRLDKLDLLIRGDADTWARLTHNLRTEDYELKIDDALARSNSTANLMKQLIAALRLPDQVSGKKPQSRGGARGAYSKVSSLDRARSKTA
jgi:hypothetical protein